MTNIYNLFKFLEDKKGKDIPLNVKLELKPDEITSEDVKRIYNKGVIKAEGPMEFIFIDGLYFPLERKKFKIKNIDLWFNDVDYFREMPLMVKINHKGY